MIIMGLFPLDFFNVPNIRNRLIAVRRKIAGAAHLAGRQPGDVRLISVSKTFDSGRICEAMEAGQCVFGESRVQEAREKIADLGRAGLEWHLIGHLQRNKVKYVFDLFDVIHSVDSLELAREINQQAGLRSRSMNILAQVNIAGDEAKFGMDPVMLPDFFREIAGLDNLSCQGLMTIPPYQEDPEGSRSFYRALRELRDQLQAEGFQAKELSMGMSHDFEVAIEEGATLVRVGSAIFGERTYV